MSKERQLWDELKMEAEASKSEMIPSVSIKSVHAPDGYEALLCMKRFQIYGKLHEVKSRAAVFNTETGEVQYETGQWVKEKSAQPKLTKVLNQLFELVEYRRQMAKK